MLLRPAIQAIALTAFLAGCSYCPPGLKDKVGLSPAPDKIVAKDEIEESDRI
jgi:hypothetical protein